MKRSRSAAAPDASNGLDPVPVALAAGLRYVSDAEPGIARRRAGKGFSYRAPDGRIIKHRGELARIRALAVPPAWQRVWISPDAKGHLQATGRDLRGRKQYRYHPDWRAVRDSAKFDRMLDFARALPGIRARVAQDLARRGLSRDKVSATVVRLLEVTLGRIGNQEYVRANQSYGLTTLRDRHVAFEGATLRFEYRGKGGKLHRISLRDRRLARIVRSCQELPGQHLFQYLDEDGERQPVGSADVNAYLQEISGESFTAKDFRTWAATVLASLALCELAGFETQTAARRNVNRAIEQVAAQLRNTPTICRKSYVHPEVVEAYLDGTLVGLLEARAETALEEDPAGLREEEVAVLALLQERLAHAADEPIGRGRALRGDALAGALRRSVEQGRAQDQAMPAMPAAK